MGKLIVVATFGEATLDELGSEPGERFGALISGHRLTVHSCVDAVSASV